MPELLKLPQFAQHYRKAQMDIGRGGIQPQLHPQRFARARGFFQLLTQPVFGDNRRHPALQYLQLLFDTVLHALSRLVKRCTVGLCYQIGTRLRNPIPARLRST